MLASTTGSKPLQYIGEQQNKAGIRSVKPPSIPRGNWKDRIDKERGRKGQTARKIEIIPKVIL